MIEYLSGKLPPAGLPVALSWSGGKDSCLALCRAHHAGADVRTLLAMLHENGAVSRSHGLGKDILQAQADALGILLETREATWEGYEQVFIHALRSLRAAGIEGMIFGDIDLEEHREWEARVCSEAGLSCWLPLWGEEREPLVEEFLASGFRARIVTVDGRRLDRKYLDRDMSPALAKEMRGLGVDPCGENGEFHTVVTDGPLFGKPLALDAIGAEERSGYWLSRLALSGGVTKPETTA